MKKRFFSFLNEQKGVLSYVYTKCSPNQVANQITCKCMYLTGGLFDKEDPFRYAYGCLNTKGEMEVACEANELMTIHSVLYGGEPNGCNSDIRKDNGCLQYRYDAKS